MNEVSSAVKQHEQLMSGAKGIVHDVYKHINWTNLVLLGSVCALATLDGVNSALSTTLRPYLMGSFSATPDQVTWTSIVYLSAKLYAFLLAARVQERFGQRRALLASSAFLLIATSASALSMAYPTLLVVRVFQGVAGGLVLALGQGALLSSFSRREQPLVQGVFALAVVVFPVTVVPALLGGYAYSGDWHLTYAWMVPIGLISFLWLIGIRESLNNVTSSSPVPFGRIILLSTSLVVVTYILQLGNRYAWLESQSIAWLGLVAIVCVLGLTFIEFIKSHSYLRYGCFQYADFTFGVSVSLFAGTTLLGSGFAIPGFAARVLNYPVWQSGLVQLYASVSATLSLLIVALCLRYTRVPGFLFIVVGLALFGTSMWKLGGVPSNVQFEGIAPWIVMRGFSVGCLFLPLTLLTLICVPAADAVAAAGFFNFGRQIGGLIGVAWMQTLLDHLVARNQTVFGQTLSYLSQGTDSYTRDIKAMVIVHGGQVQEAPTMAIALMLHQAYRQMLCVAYNGCFQSLAMLFVFGFPLVMIVRVMTLRLLKPKS